MRRYFLDLVTGGICRGASLGSPFILLASFALIISSSHSSRADDPLSLDTLLSSTRRLFPAILAAREQKKEAEASVQSARGGFDAKWKSEVKSYASGYYDGKLVESRIEKPLPLNGIQLEGGYRRSEGEFPLYEGDLDTASAGELGLGIALPLVRDRAIDETRAKVASSELGVKGAEAKVQQSQIAVLREARSAYWTWIAANLQQKVIENLVAVAEVRNTQLEAAVRAGDKPEFDLTDNSRTIFKRQSELAKAEQIKAKSAIQLSLYYRDEEGNPIVPGDALVPASLAHTLDVNSLDEAALIDEALRSRPELQVLDAKEKKAGIQVALGENLLKPRVDLKLGAYHPSGTGEKSLVEDELKVGLKFEVPLELNKPRGMISEGLAQKEAVSQKTRLVRDKIAAEIKKTLTTLQLAEQRITAARESRIAADKVAEGERIRFDHGDSNLVFVVLREQTAAEAALEEIGALLDFHLVHADLLAALGQG